LSTHPHPPLAASSPPSLSAAPLHPLNDSFSWQPPHPPFRRLTPALERAWNEQGFFLVEDAFDATTLAGMLADIDPWEEKVEAFLRTRPDGRFFIARAGEITFTTYLVTRSPLLRRLAGAPPLVDWVHDLVGPDARLYHDQAVYKKPETEAPFPWHQDNGYKFVRPQQYVTFWIALTDATEENGCPWVVPGAHLRGTLAHTLGPLGYVCCSEPPPDAVCVPARAGSIVVFSSLTPHATGPNRTRSTRKAWIVQYAPDGATKLEPDGKGGYAPTPADDPGFQFRVVVDGHDAPSSEGELS
jgi:ectoine hydroxylase-related dioxygenase (phytanoyl-CoA dioxygenase family)